MYKNKLVPFISFVLTVTHLIAVGGLFKPVFAEETVIIGLTVPKGSPDEQFQRLFISELYRRVGIKVEIKHYPIKRTSIMANKGVFDGEAERVYDYSNRFTNLIRVNESHRSLKFIAYVNTPSIKLNQQGWEALRNTAYQVDYQRGIKKAEEMLNKLVNPENLFEIDRIEQGLKRLKSGRTDILITSESWMKGSLKEQKHRNFKIYEAGLMEEVKLYTYLHKKHKKLIPELSEALKEMKTEGVLAELIYSAFDKH